MEQGGERKERAREQERREKTNRIMENYDSHSFEHGRKPS